MMRREKKKDKFFTRMSIGLKGLWKFLKTRKKLPSPRTNSDDKVLDTWLDDEEEEKETTSNSST